MKGKHDQMIKSEIVIDQHYKDFSPMQFGSETCDPGHFFGPSVRTHWLLHYIVYGFGRFERDGISYSVKPGDIFVIPPYEKTYYEADQKKLIPLPRLPFVRSRLFPCARRACLTGTSPSIWGFPKPPSANICKVF